jgi:hypothetical protein
MKYYYDSLRDAYHTICTEEKRKKNLIKEYGGFRRTASNAFVARDEPGSDLELRQSDSIRRNQLERTKRIAKEKLKAKGAVPKRGGQPLKTFEQFQSDAGRGLTEELTKKQVELMKQVHASAQHLSYDKWMLFITTMLE